MLMAPTMTKAFNPSRFVTNWLSPQDYTGLILGLRPANERRRYKVTPSLISWAQNLHSALLQPSYQLPGS